MLPRTVRLTATTVTALGLLTACGGGSASPSPSQSPSTSPSADAGPKVPAPLPTQALLNDPCSILTAAEATKVGLASPGRKNSTGLSGCAWSSSSTEQNEVGLTPLPQNTGGISDIYNNKPRSAYFEPVDIDGYPGVYSDIQDARTQGSCTLWVGITDQLAVSVIPQIGVGPNKNDPCGIAKKFATAMITHLKS
jgi:hypothetical protein